MDYILWAGLNQCISTFNTNTLNPLFSGRRICFLCNSKLMQVVVALEGMYDIFLDNTRPMNVTFLCQYRHKSHVKSGSENALFDHKTQNAY